MCGNRVEELESRVKELEASIEGLTDELVECKVRLRELETAVDDDLGFVPEGEKREREAAEQREAETADSDKTEPAEGESEESDESESDIIIA